MLRSLFSGISSLRSHQTMLDVTGNNIANANTTGFKSSRTQFEDTLSQMIQAPGAPQGQNGGTNPAQVGLGVRVAGISTDFTPGAAQQTGRSLDMMIDGDGFFVVNGGGGEQLYTRNGAFSLDATGQLVTASGARVMGWAADANGVVNANGPLSPLSLPVTTTMGARATSTVTFGGNLPADAKVADPTATPPVEATTLLRSIEVYSADGTPTPVDVSFTLQASSPSATWAVSVADRSGTQLGTGTVTFNANGSLQNVTLPPVTVGGSAVTLDLGALTGFAALTTVEASGQDGQGAGVLQSFAMASDGTLIGSFSNGLKRAVGQVAVSTFANSGGLEKAGGSMLRASVNSGDPQVGVAGQGGRGDLTGGALEMSNVDLSQEFTNLIVAQRGFQAGSRVITTSDELLQELVNLKR
ncbi:flagellar hook protein FlgE [Georgenia sp. 311]|uniref:Flagellar hook protein FlgE n=1 Tax=Georgenia wutianyii TaxID=2585135 RepID=A0ABX5VLI2_9MICO|nr:MULTISPECIES: flagellar hook protein FlgE [Georgenia]QDB78173.1 flagellar hook protein FlgE [Georgenia wutianyii]TNC21252.1 flagellar hook protein FlgE [Georgenia sp. 311]